MEQENEGECFTTTRFPHLDIVAPKKKLIQSNCAQLFCDVLLYRYWELEMCWGEEAEGEFKLKTKSLTL